MPLLFLVTRNIRCTLYIDYTTAAVPNPIGQTQIPAGEKESWPDRLDVFSSHGNHGWLIAPGIGTLNPLLVRRGITPFRTNLLTMKQQGIELSSCFSKLTRVYAIPTTPYSVTYCKVTCSMCPCSTFHGTISRRKEIPL